MDRLLLFISLLRSCHGCADFVYADYLTAVGSDFRGIVWKIAEDYALATKLLRLPGYCPMPAFREIVDVPLVVRKARKTRDQVSLIHACPCIC